MNEITVNGVEYIEKTEANSSDHIIVIADRGWIFEGHKIECEIDGVQLVKANVIRKWSNGLGIGGFADPDHKDDYTLDCIGDIVIPTHSVIAMIPCRW